ncbi:MAG: class I SAM-dependent methyltransferase [Lysobacter sp.]|nr:class I SAM-dependent methyltransferase [Lysobacter sp.]
MDHASRDEYIQLIQNFFAHEVKLRLESDWPVTDAAYQNLSDADTALIERRVGDVFGDAEREALERWRDASYPHYRREILRYGCSVETELLWRKTLMTPATPPAEVHSMMRNEVFAGDLYSGDMIVAALKRAGMELIDHARYLDFGCSSGALVRNLAAAFPGSRWHGCDPVKDSIAWAGQHIPFVSFYNSMQQPPLEYPDRFFNGVYAVSIWSHFSERAALAWFEEMHRLISPGGFLVFTTHGIRSIYYYLSEDRILFDTAKTLMRDMSETGYGFQPVWENGSKEADFLETSDWGNAYFTLTWVTMHLGAKWRVRDYVPGINQCNQDIYVLERT